MLFIHLHLNRIFRLYTGTYSPTTQPALAESIGNTVRIAAMDGVANIHQPTLSHCQHHLASTNHRSANMGRRRGREMEAHLLPWNESAWKYTFVLPFLVT